MKRVLSLLSALVLAAGLAVGVGAAPAGAAPADAAGGPPAVTVKFNVKTATVSWGAVGGGVQKYTVIVSRDGFSGPFRGYTTTDTSINIAYSSFPYASTKSSKPFRFSVTATGKGWSSVSGKVKVSTSGSRVADTTTGSAGAAALLGIRENDVAVAASGIASAPQSAAGANVARPVAENLAWNLWRPEWTTTTARASSTP